MTPSPVRHRHSEACRGADEVLTLVPGLTYRQLDFWTTKGYIWVNDAHPGHGIYRCWDRSEVDVLRRAMRLIDHGFRAREAVETARKPSVDALLDLLERQSA